MKQSPLRKLRCAISLAAALALLAGCTAPSSPAPSSGSGNQMMGGSQNGTGGMQGNTPSGAGSYSSVGQRIWLTGVGGDGQSIPRTAPRTSEGALMMGGGGCASCHGTDGRGGTIQMMMGLAITAPDVMYAALIKAGYTDATIGRAITQGLDEGGEALDQAMPRWQMSASDVQATIAYLKQLGS